MLKDFEKLAKQKVDQQNRDVHGREKCQKCNAPRHYHIETNSLLCDQCDREELKKAIAKMKKQLQSWKDSDKWHYHPFYGFRRNKTHSKYIRRDRYS